MRLIPYKTTVFFMVTKQMQYICYIEDLKAQIKDLRSLPLKLPPFGKRMTRKWRCTEKCAKNMMNFTVNGGYHLEGGMKTSLLALESLENQVRFGRKVANNVVQGKLNSVRYFRKWLLQVDFFSPYFLFFFLFQFLVPQPFLLPFLFFFQLPPFFSYFLPFYTLFFLLFLLL